MEKDTQNQEFYSIILQSCSNPLVCVNYIKKNPENMEKLLNFIFSMQTYKNEIWQILIFLMLEQNPSLFIKYLKEKGVGSSVCGKQWKSSQHDLCYHCKDCESDPSCAICEDCFEPEKHEGHDYRIVKAGGGCCDCGDESAWKPSGFCKKHSGNNGELDLSSILPQNVIQSSQKVIRSLLIWMAKNIKQSIVNVQENNNYNQKLLGMIKFIETFCKSFGDPFKKLLTLQLIDEVIDISELTSQRESKTGKISPMEFLMVMDNKLHSAIQKAFHNLYFPLLGDTDFKKNFSFLFAKYYAILYEESKDREKYPQSLLHFSVQLLTVTNLSPILCKEYNIFQNILQTVEKTLTSCQVKSTDEKDKRPILDTSNTHFSQSHIYSTLNDFGYLVLQKPVSSLLLTQSRDLKHYLKLIKIFQGSLLLKRKLGEHVLFDSSDQYNDSFSLEIEFIGKFALPIFSSLSTETPATPSEQYLTQLFSVSSKIISTFIKYAETFNWEWAKKTKEKPRMISYVPEKDFMTPFLPLQRILSVFVSHHLVDLRESTVTLPDFFKDVETDVFHKMLQEIINFHVFKYQSEAKLWVRNGNVAEIIASAYQLKWNHFYCVNSDIFFYQMCSIMIGKESFLSILMENFKLNDWKQYLTNAKKPERNTAFHCDVIASSLKLLSTILVDRTCSASKDETLEKEIVHFLFALEPISFSKLTKSVSDVIAKNKRFEEVLNKVATKKKGEGNEVLFVVKPAYWAKYDRYFTHYDRAQAQKAEENYVEQMKKKKENPPLPFPKVSPFLPALSEIKGIAQSLQVHQLILVALQNYQSEYFNEKVLTEVLCLLYICIEFAYEEQNEKNTFNLLQDIKDKTESSQIVNALWKIRCDEKHQYHHSSIDAILTQLSDDNEIKEMIQQLKNESGSDKKDNEEDKKELQKKKAKERQFKLMEKMKQKQNKFANSNEAVKLEKTAPKKEEEEEEKCVLCMEAQNDVDKNPLCYITAFISSNTCHQLRRRNLSTSLNVGAKLVPQKEEDPFSRLIEGDVPQENKRQKFSLTASFDESASDNSLKIEEFNNSSSTQVEREQLHTELNRSVEETDSLYLRSCGHLMHFKCYQSYLEKLLKEESEAPTIEGINLEKGEFICPLCKSIGSTVAPVFPQAEISEQKTEKLPFSMWFSSYLENSSQSSNIKLFPKISSDSEWAQAYDLFLQYANLNQQNLWPHPSAPLERIFSIIWNSVVYTLSATEISLRGKDYTQFPTVKLRELQQFSYITKLVSTVIANREDKRSVSSESLKYLWNFIISKKPTNYLLRFDAFSFMVRLMFSNSIINSQFDVVNKNNYYELFWQINVIQQIYTVYNYCTTLFNLSPSFKNSWKKRAEEVSNKSDISSIEDLCLFVVHHINKKTSENSPKTSEMQDEISEEFHVSKIVPLLKFLSLSFLRKVALFEIFVLKDPKLSFAASLFNDASSESHSEVFASLTQFLGLPGSFEALFSKEGSFSVSSPHLINAITNLSDPSLVYFVEPPKIFEFVELPKMLQDPKFYLVMTKTICDKCQKVPKIPLLCLLCNKIVCCRSDCCKEGKIGEANTHARDFHHGESIYLIIKESHILIITKNGGSLHSSPYLDKYGEQDQGLTRGQPVFLEPKRIEMLKQLYLDHKLSQKTVEQHHQMLYRHRNQWHTF